MKFIINLVVMLIMLNISTTYSKNINSFIENKGQIYDFNGSSESNILFYSIQQDFGYFINKNSISIVTKSNDNLKYSIDPNNQIIFRYDIEFLNSNENFTIETKDKNFEKFNYYLKKIFLTDINSYNKLVFRDYYKNVDLVYRFSNENLKYDFVVHPGGLIQNINFKLNGVKSYYINESGDLIIETPVGTFSKPRPFVYQYDKKGEKILLNSEYLISDNVIKFVILENFDSTKDLIIDPEIGLISYCGGNGDDGLLSVKQDNNGDFYLTGESESLDFPITPGSHQITNQGSIDCVILKFDSNWKLLWSTYMGGSSIDRFMDVNLDNNYLWLTGETTSSDFPATTDAYQTFYGGGSGDVIISKFDKSGKLIYSSFFGSLSYDSSPEACLDSYGNLWLTGRTNGAIPLTIDAEQSSGGAMYNGIIVKFNPIGKLLYSSLYSSDVNVYGEGIICDNLNNIFITGYTDSKKLPNSSKGFQRQSGGGYDAYIAKFDNDGKNMWSTLIGGTDNEYCSNISIDENSNIYIFGHTGSSNFPVKNPYQDKLNGGFDSFLSKLSTNSNLIWSTFFGGNGFEGFENSIYYQLAGLEVKDGQIALAAATTSTNLTISNNSFQKKIAGGTDAYISLFDSESGNMNYCTYFGGSGYDRPYDLIFDKDNNIINVGKSNSKNLPTTKGVFQDKNAGQTDGYIIGVKANICKNLVSYSTFDNVNHIYLNGDAMYVDDYIRLTNNKEKQSSSMWLIDKVGIDKGFETTFSFSIEDAKDPSDHKDTPLPGADGIAIVMQNHSLLTKGSSGGSIGFQGIPNSIAIEYDMFYNEENFINDPNGNHIAVFSNGILPNDCNHKSNSLLGQVDIVNPFKTDGSIFYSKLIYNGIERSLKIFLSDNPLKLNESVLEIKNFNINNLINTGADSSLWIGFTSATGRSFQKHSILSWQLCSYDNSPKSVDVESNNNDIKEWEIYPNPVNDILNIITEFNFINYAKIDIIDIFGRVILTKEINSSEVNNNVNINLNNIANGVYFCQIFNNNIVKSLKFIKM